MHFYKLIEKLSTPTITLTFYRHGTSCLQSRVGWGVHSCLKIRDKPKTYVINRKISNLYCLNFHIANHAVSYNNYISSSLQSYRSIVLQILFYIAYEDDGKGVLLKITGEGTAPRPLLDSTHLYYICC